MDREIAFHGPLLVEEASSHVEETLSQEEELPADDYVVRKCRVWRPHEEGTDPLLVDESGHQPHSQCIDMGRVETTTVFVVVDELDDFVVIAAAEIHQIGHLFLQN